MSMKWADTSRTGLPFSKDPSVIRFGGRYLLYYSLPPATGETAWGIGIAESSDLEHWSKIGEVLPLQACEANGLCAPGARVLGGKVHLFYQTYGNGPADAICHAVSCDGLHFERDASNPIFHPQGAWTVGRAIDAEVIPFNGRLMLYCATRDPQMRIQMLAAASAPLDSDYSRPCWTPLGDGPVLCPELPWEYECIEAPTFCLREGRLVMFYAGGYNCQPQQIGVAVSEDGLHWRRLSDEPLLRHGRPGEWNASESGHPGVFVDDDGQTYLFYQGCDDGGKTWFLSQVKIGWRDEMPYVVI